MALHGAFHFNRMTVLGRNEIRTDEQKNDVCRLKADIDLLLPFSTRRDFAVVPPAKNVLPLQQ